MSASMQFFLPPNLKKKSGYLKGEAPDGPVTRASSAVHVRSGYTRQLYLQKQGIDRPGNGHNVHVSAVPVW